MQQPWCLPPPAFLVARDYRWDFLSRQNWHRLNLREHINLPPLDISSLLARSVADLVHQSLHKIFLQNIFTELYISRLNKIFDT